MINYLRGFIYQAYIHTIFSFKRFSFNFNCFATRSKAVSTALNKIYGHGLWTSGEAVKSPIMFFCW